MTDISYFVSLSIQKAKLSIGHHGERSLESFCHWQNEEYGGAKYLGNNQVPGARDDTPPVDAAVFVTRYSEVSFISLLNQYWPVVTYEVTWSSSNRRKRSIDDAFSTWVLFGGLKFALFFFLCMFNDVQKHCQSP